MPNADKTAAINTSPEPIISNIIDKAMLISCGTVTYGLKG
jgi:hypothetical protein